ncbi:MAG TPA: hypothetical protein VGS20_09310 [Candidatus Acidoferrales bacterium]|nr:hypothetical protein [Candidatus Acidoferrales bacterium]
MRTTLQAFTGAVLYLVAGMLLLGRARLVQAWGIRMALKYPHLYSSAAFRNWLHSPGYVPFLQVVGAAAVAISALLFYAGCSSVKR